MVAELKRTSDEAIRKDVLLELEADPELASSDIAIAVKDGVVTLSGLVSSYWEKQTAEKAVKRVRGVRGIANDIKLNLTSVRTDPEIARDVVHAIERHVSLPADKIKATVKNGWVTLEGTVESQYQKIIAEDAVKPIRGIIGITNNIETRPPASPTAVKRKIEEGLRRRADIDASHITVETNGGTVRLYGSVRSWAEREETENLAWSVPGVVEVENHITVEP